MNLLAAEVDHTGSSPLLVAAALIGIAVVVVLITVLKVHPFLALIPGSAVLGVIAGVGVSDIVTSFTAGVGSTVGSVGLLIALGAMIGGLLTASGGADRVVTAIVDRVSPKALPWAMGGVAALIGIPLFFEIGVVLLIPIVLLVAHRSGQSVLRVGIPAQRAPTADHGLRTARGGRPAARLGRHRRRPLGHPAAGPATPGRRPDPATLGLALVCAALAAEALPQSGLLPPPAALAVVVGSWTVGGLGIGLAYPLLGAGVYSLATSLNATTRSAIGGGFLLAAVVSVVTLLITTRRPAG